MTSPSGPEAGAPGTAGHAADQAFDRVASRRRLLRGGVLATGAAAGLVIAGSALPAQAADGDPLVAGRSVAADSTTTLTIGDGTEPALALENGDGPSLYLQPLAADFANELELGQIANTDLGPVLGVDTTVGHATTFLATGIDLADLPTPYALPKPVRLLDTRTSAGRARIVRTSSNPFDAAFRLVPGAWLDVEVTVEDDDLEVPAAHLNVTVTGSTAAGFLTAYPPGDFPGISTLNWVAKQTIANHAFVATGIVLGRYAVRVRTNAATHVVIDLTGVTIKGGDPTPAAAARTRAAARSGSQREALRVRLRSSMANRLRARISG